MITAVILSHNETDLLERALNSVSFCDQTIVVDDRSEPQTLKIIKRHKAQLFQRTLNGDYAAQRNFALSKVTTPWTLFLDADEHIPPALQKEIVATIKNTNNTGFYIKRSDHFLGKLLKHGETSHIKLLRLARTKSGQWHRPVHETWQIKGRVGELTNPIIHRPHSSLSEFLSSINRYTTIEAKHRTQTRHPFHLSDIITYPAAKFILNYFIKLGLLDGFPGFVHAYFMSLHSLTVRIKHYEKTRS